MASSFSKLEEAALRAIFAETADLAPALERQFQEATVTKRENTGAGFFTSIAVPEDVPQVNSPRVLGQATFAHIDGLTHGLGFALFLEEGRLSLLDGHVFGQEDTTHLNFELIGFAISQSLDDRT